MRIQARWFLLAMAVLGTLWLLGCGQKKTEPQAMPQAGQQPAAEKSEPIGASEEHGEGGGTIVPAGSVAEIWTQIAGEQNKLSIAIQNGQLKDVHHLAFGIRDLVVALASKAGESSPNRASKLAGLVKQVKVSAGKLDELGDAGNLGGTQAEFAKLNAILDTIRMATNPK